MLPCSNYCSTLQGRTVDYLSRFAIVRKMKPTLVSTKRAFAWLAWPPAVTFSLVFVLFLLLALQQLDPDFGWHLASGEYFVRHGIPATDIFTYTAADFPWVNHEWLSDIIVSWIYSLGGYGLLAALFAGMWTLALFITGRRVYGPIVLLGVIAVMPFMGVRAVTWTVLGVAILYALVTARNQRLWAFIPLLFLAWANLHGGVAIGLVLVAYWAIAKRSVALSLLLALSAAVTLVNPYGVGLYVEIFRTMLDGSLRWVIAEWIPIGDIWQTVCYVAVWGAGFLLLYGKKWRRYFQVDVLVFLAALSSIRHYPLFVVLSLPFTGQYVTEVVRKIPAKLHVAQLRILLLVSGVIILISGWGIYDMYSLSFDKESTYPRAAVAYLQKHPCDGNVFNDYGSGGYLIWKLPDQKVYIDGRMPSWEHNGRKYMTDYLRIFEDDAFRKEQFETHTINCALIRDTDKHPSLADHLRSDGWREVSNDGRFVLLER